MDAKPYGAVAQFQRLCKKKMKERYGDPNDNDGELPPIMEDLLQLACDGASVNHALHAVILCGGSTPTPTRKWIV